MPEGEGGWTDIATPDAIVRYYDPTDVFGDLAEAIADAYPGVTDEAEDDDATRTTRTPRPTSRRGRRRRRRRATRATTAEDADDEFAALDGRNRG